MRFRIAKEFAFSASHQLTHLLATQPDHQCGRLHGHNYVVTVELSGTGLNDAGFVRDYGELSRIKDFIDGELDHRHLNDVLGSSRDTTAENLARRLFVLFSGWYPEVTAVRVSETPKTWSEYRP